MKIKKLRCLEVREGFEDLFKVGVEYPIVDESPNGMAWNIQMSRYGSPTFVARNSIFGLFEVITYD